MKETLKDIGTNARATAMDGLISVANFFGAGSAVEGLIRRIFGKKEIPTAAEVETIVTSIISNAKAKNNAEITKLQNRLNDIPLVKSSLQKDVIDREIEKIRGQILKRQATSDLADDLANSAMNTAGNISIANASDRKEMANEAVNKAKQAASLYENTAADPVKVENIIGG